ncbi:MAG: hypothetical protein ABJE95_01765 [Byssovorax sp.]
MVSIGPRIGSGNQEDRGTGGDFLLPGASPCTTALLAAGKWKVVDVQLGGAGGSIDNKTFVGGSATS